MKTTPLFLLLVLLVLVCTAHSAAVKPTRRTHRHYLEKVIQLARTSNSTLNETLLQTFVLDLSHLTRTASHCKTFLCQAHDILGPLLGETHQLVRNLYLYTQHQRGERACQVKETGKMHLRKFLEDLRFCAQRVNSHAEP